VAVTAGGVTRKEAVATNKQFQQNLKDTGAGSEGGKYPKGGGPNNPLGVNQYKGEGGGGGGGKGGKGSGGKKAAAKKKAGAGSAGAKKAAAKKVAAGKVSPANLKKLSPAQILALGRKQEAERRRKAGMTAAAKKKADADFAKAAYQAEIDRVQRQHDQQVRARQHRTAGRL
jgi:hypothetical protein